MRIGLRFPGFCNRFRPPLNKTPSTSGQPHHTCVRNLVIVLGDQLDIGSAAFDGFDKTSDVVWMAEVAGESRHVWSHKARIVMFLSAMRHFHEQLREAGLCTYYRLLSDP